MYTVYIAGIAD